MQSDKGRALIVYAPSETNAAPSAAHLQRTVPAFSALPTRKRVNALARFFKVSERAVWSAIFIRRHGSQELVRDVESGKISIHAAEQSLRRQTAPHSAPDTYTPLERAWRKAEPAARLQLLFHIQHSAGLDASSTLDLFWTLAFAGLDASEEQ